MQYHAAVLDVVVSFNIYCGVGVSQARSARLLSLVARDDSSHPERRRRSKRTEKILYSAAVYMIWRNLSRSDLFRCGFFSKRKMRCRSEARRWQKYVNRKERVNSKKQNMNRSCRRSNKAHVLKSSIWSRVVFIPAFTKQIRNFNISH